VRFGEQLEGITPALLPKKAACDAAQTGQSADGEAPSLTRDYPYRSEVLVGKDETAGRRKYEPPTVTLATAGKLSPKVRSEVARMLSEMTSEEPSFPKSNGELRIELSLEGKFKNVSEEFCVLVGYTRNELLGRRIDEITMPRTLHIRQHLGAVLQFGSFHCLWMFARNDGRVVLVRTDWELLPDLSMEVHCAPLRVSV
jgi:PAS domain S-box-containing protein